ncbi:MAG: SpoIIE family protein phosphatase [Oscillospiraceae bacterium]|jgi:stage II sporulation protein E|nr:SpoIIE family protein phosphatase [Oscillospiraceae bacterium]
MLITEKKQSKKQGQVKSVLPAQGIILFCAVQAGALFLGGLLAHSGLAGGVFAASAPFAIAFAASIAIEYLGALVLGAAFACLLFLPYPQNIAAMAAIAIAGLVNIALRHFRLPRTAIVPIAAGLCSLAAGMMPLAQSQGDAIQWLYAAAGGILAAMGAWFCVGAGAGSRVLHYGAVHPKLCYRVTKRRRLALLMVCGMAIASMSLLRIGAFSSARIFGVLLVLGSAYFWNETGGSLAGAIVGGMHTLGGGDGETAVVFALGGLLAGTLGAKSAHFDGGDGNAGAFAAFPTVGGFAVICSIFTLIFGGIREETEISVVFAIETFFSSVLFLLIPRKRLSQWRRVCNTDFSPAPPAQADLCIRLHDSALSLRRVSEYVTEVSKGLEKLRQPLEQQVCAYAERSVCSACAEYAICWRENAAQTTEAFTHVLRHLRENVPLTPALLMQLQCQSGATQICRHGKELSDTLSLAFENYTARADCYQKETFLRLAAANQFETLAELLEDLSDHTARNQTFDDQTSQVAASVLEDAGCGVEAISAVRLPSGITQISTVVRAPEDVLNLELLTKQLARQTGLALDYPTKSCDDKGYTVLKFVQKPPLTVSVGAVQMSCKANEYCGDYFDCLEDGNGHQLIVLSDGMGTGGRAAVDSALATEIFVTFGRSGMKPACTMRMANAALLLKSSEESLATLDVATIDLFTGALTICKAGAVSSYLRQGSKVKRIEMSALPAGILRNISPAICTEQLQAGDMLIMVSDGMLSDSDAWLCESIAAAEDKCDPQTFAESLAAQAVEQRGDARRDDLTVLCALVQ